MRLLVLVLVLLAGGAAHARTPWIASPEVVLAPSGERVSDVSGLVFEDRNGDGRHQRGEPGIANVLVTNGLDVVATDRQGRWRLPVRPDMNLMVVQPSGWEVPVDARMVPQFAHVHKAGGSPDRLRFGGLADRPPPVTVNFPLRRAPDRRRFSCTVLGDPQAYSGAEVGYFRDGVVADILRDPPGTHACSIWVGDNVGDDLDLLDRLLEAGGTARTPQWLVVGNHDIDFDARRPEDSADSFRRIWGPDYWAMEVGRVLFVGLNNIVYPCGERDVGPGDRQACAPGRPTTYNGRLSDLQMEWLRKLLARVPRDRKVVIAHHIPLVSFADSTSSRHQTDNAAEIHALLAGRAALSVSGHTHTIENHAPGQWYEGWRQAVNVGPLPFRHIVVGAASGAWFQGDFDHFGVPMALQRLGAPRGHLRLDFDGTAMRERYVGSRLEPDRVAWIGLNTPEFRRWFDAVTAWAAEPEQRRDPVPPASAHDLPDPRIVTRAGLAEGSFLTVNVWAGDAATRVTLSVNDGAPQPLQRTQAGAGEAPLRGAEWACPFATLRQLSVGRFAMQSRSGEARNQGMEAFRGRQFGPAPPQPMGSVASLSPRLWRARLPADLPEGVHVATVEITDRHDVTTVERFPFEVRNDPPPMRFRRELFAD